MRSSLRKIQLVIVILLNMSPVSGQVPIKDTVQIPIQSTPELATSPSGEEMETVITSKSTGMKLVLIPAGTFLMGSSSSELDTARKADKHFDEYAAEGETQHHVKISRSFYMGVHEVTQRQFELVVGTNPSYFSEHGEGSDDVRYVDTQKLPVEQVLWGDALDFCRMLSERDGIHYRLPTEAEWEYACRGGSTTSWNTGDTLQSLSDAGWWGHYGGNTGNSPRSTNGVGQKGKNRFGLFDMHGNVFEWCEDVYDKVAYSNRKGTTIDPIVKRGGPTHVMRGGSWKNEASVARSACRSHNGDLRDRTIGFRVVSTGIQITAAPEPPQTANVHAATRQEITSKFTGMKFVKIPAGTFTMGSSEEDIRLVARVDRKNVDDYAKAFQPPHPVTISRPFYIGVYEVTQAEYEKVTGRNPSDFSNEESKQLDAKQLPVESVSWFDAIEFCNALSGRDGLNENYKLRNIQRHGNSITSATVTTVNSNGYRLPTEAEWEYACRAGTTSVWNTGNTLKAMDEAGWWGTVVTDSGNSNRRTHVVGQKLQNNFGLFDMHGNVCEWCEDQYDESANSKRNGNLTDPIGSAGLPFRAVRGGAWMADAGTASSACRVGLPPGVKSSFTGFRVVIGDARIP